MIAVSALVVWTFNIDVVFVMMKAYGVAPADVGYTPLSRWLTALILAGGSAGVYRILVALGYREVKAPEQVRPRPPKNKAWISVRTTRKIAVGPIHVRITELGAAMDGSPSTLAGIISTEGFWRTLWSIFFLDRSRFPPAGGYEVVPDKEYRLEVTAKNAAGVEISADINGVYAFADGAIIDFKATL